MKLIAVILISIGLMGVIAGIFILPTLLGPGYPMPPAVKITSFDESYWQGKYVFCLAHGDPEHEVLESWLLIMDDQGTILYHNYIGSAYFDYIYQVTATTFFYKTSGRREHPEIQDAYLWNMETGKTVKVLEGINIGGHHELLIEDGFFSTLRRTGKHGWDTIELIDPVKNISSILFNSTSFFPSKPHLMARNNDWLHSNDITVSLDGNYYYVNFRNADSFGKVDKNTGELIWICGRNGDFDLGDNVALHSFSHVIKEIEPNVFLMFDNDAWNLSRNTYPNEWEGPFISNYGGISRLIEITVNEVSMKATVTWNYTPSSDYYCAYFGDVDLLPNGNILGCFGGGPHKFSMDGSEMNKPFGAALHEVNGSKLIREYVWPSGYNIYRVQQYSSNPDDWINMFWLK